MQDEYAKRIMKMMTDAVTEFDAEDGDVGDVVVALAQAYIMLAGTNGFLQGFCGPDDGSFDELFPIKAKQ